MNARHAGAVFREALAAARSQKVASLSTIILVAAMCVAVILTSGRAVGAERNVLETIDSAGTRSIIIRAGAEAGLDSSILDRIRYVDGIESAAALGPALDVRNAALPDGNPVPLRALWSTEVTDERNQPGVLVSETATQHLGMLHAAGAVMRPDGTTETIAGPLGHRPELAPFEPLALIPQTAAGDVAVVLVVASEASEVAALTEVIRPLIVADDAAQITLDSSAELASLRSSVSNQLGAFGASLTAAIFSLTGILVAAVQTALVLLRRKDFGRRRALGATRSLIVALILIQATALAVVGCVAGIGLGSAALAVGADPVPGIDYLIAIGILAILVTTVATTIPAALAATRDPIRELRVA